MTINNHNISNLQDNNIKLLFVTGIQKSGTSLLNRVLIAQDFIENPFLPEGKFFWGDDPVNNPTSSPCGEIYQSHGAQKGHQILAEDFQVEHQSLLKSKIQEVSMNAPVLMNKNPNLIVRLPWVKKVFPDSKIIVVIRDPVANIYSFSKKLHLQKKENADFWWGVKPNNWQSLINANALKQIVSVWQTVFTFLMEHIGFVDMFINYQQFCESPQKYIDQIALNLDQSKPETNLPFDHLTCMDDEYQRGGNLESKNVLLRKDKTFKIKNSLLNEINYPPFTDKQVTWIKTQTDPLWHEFQSTIKAI